MTKSQWTVVKPELIKQALRKKANGQTGILRTRMVEVAEHVTDNPVTWLTVAHMEELAADLNGTYVKGKIWF